MRKKGFTLIELLIVVAIIAILAAIAVPNFLEAQVRSKVSRSWADMRSLATAIEAYAAEYNAYPPDGGKTADGDGFWYVPNRVTTPIAFISSAKLIDPFRLDKDAGAARLSDIPDGLLYENADYRRYRYRNFKYTYYSITYPGRVTVYEEIYGKWELMGSGPDQSAGPFVYPTIGGYTLELTIPYDATNGTMSRGNLIRSQKYSDGMKPVWE